MGTRVSAAEPMPQAATCRGHASSRIEPKVGRGKRRRMADEWHDR